MTQKIFDKDLRKVLYRPELYPVCSSFTASASAETLEGRLSERELEQKRNALILSFLTQPRDANISIRLKIDDRMLPDIATTSLYAFPEYEEIGELSKKRFELYYYNSSGLDIAYKCRMGIWFPYMSVANKLLFGIKLKRGERQLMEKYGLDSTFEKGILPLKLPLNPVNDLQTQLEREYQVERREVRTYSQDIDANSEERMVDPTHPEPDKFFVLKEVATDTQDCIIKIARESLDLETINLDCNALSLDKGMPMWLHAFTLLSFFAENPTGSAITVNLKIKYDVCRISNIIRARMFPEELLEERPELEEFVERIECGIW